MLMYDVVVIGAGPAGGQCARDLAYANKRVLLIEKNQTFLTNNFSSGGAPLCMMQEYLLPDHLIGTYWNKLSIVTSHNSHSWNHSTPSGVVCDFAKLRTFLANEAIKHKADLKLHTSYLGHQVGKNSCFVEIQNLDTHEKQVIETKVLVDATGTERKVLMNGKMDKRKTVTATGIEHLLQVAPDDYQRFSNSLNFYFGHHWMPQGYGWIFPMKDNQLKIGIIRYFPNETIVSHDNSYTYYLDQLIKSNLKNPPEKLLDKHGKTLHYCLGQKDLRYKHNVIAIGDAISTLNPMACEGIRHALFSGRNAAKHILEYLEGNLTTFSTYKKEMDRFFGWKWYLSERVMNHIYKHHEDQSFDQMLETFKTLSFKEMLDFSFGYKLRTIAKLFVNYGLSKIT